LSTRFGGSRRPPLAIECKWSAGRFDAANLQAFRQQHPRGENVVLAADVKVAFHRNHGALKVRFEGLESFVSRLTGISGTDGNMAPRNSRLT
jgi:hypothetical protein